MTEDCKVRQLREVQAALPPARRDINLQAEIKSQQAANSLPVLVVLDDDPTGTQTCHGINVLSVWDLPTLIAEFESGCAGFFVLTNSRALAPPAARTLIRTICQSVKEAASIVDKTFEVVLRGDSTLRGHFPDEPLVAEEVFGRFDAWVLAPFFRQGGRYTIDDVHYVANPDGFLVPAAQTPFAADATFGYRNSNLRKYVHEKSKGDIQLEQVDSVTLSDIRDGGPEVVSQRLLDMPTGAVVIVNSIEDEDMEVFVQGLLRAQSQGKRYLYRTGAAFVSTRLGISQIPPLSAQDLTMDTSGRAPGGLIIAGSYVPKTTTQLEKLVNGRGERLNTITLDVERLLSNENEASQTIHQAVDDANRLIKAGQDVLVMTSRKLIVGEDDIKSLNIGSVVAATLVQFLQKLNVRPRYLIAKGGITSSDMATKGLRMRRALIQGQAAPGVPLWRCDESTSKFAGIPYVVFPGNVGGESTLLDLVASWEKTSERPTFPPMQYQRLGSSGLKISRVILGCMTFGNPNWNGSPWILSEDESLPLLKKAYDAGINTWETADTYSNGESERIIGKALVKYNIPRSKVVIMTKLYYPVLEDTPDARPQPAHNDGPLVNQMGLSRKHIFEAVHAPLRRLNTSYIDVVQLHRLDADTEPAETMGALHDLIKQGKIHYIGASSMYCWQLARLQYAAKLNGYTPFSSMQGLYNLLYREEERDMNPFCAAEGIGLIPWSPLARGLLARPWDTVTARSAQDTKTKKWFQGSQDAEIVGRVQKMASKYGVSMASVALAWCLHKGACPVVGLNSAERIERVAEAFEVELSEGDLKFLEQPYVPLNVQAI